MSQEVKVCKVSKESVDSSSERKSKNFSRSKSGTRERRRSVTSSDESRDYSTDDDTASDSDYHTSECSEISSSEEAITDDLLYRVLSKFFMTSDNKKNISDVIKDLNNRLDEIGTKIDKIYKCIEDD